MEDTEFVHCIWKFAVALKVNLRIDRVPTELNISDLPSREEYALLDRLGSTWVPPNLHESFWQPHSWAALSVLGIV